MFPLLKRVLPDEWVLPEPGTLEDRALGAYMGLAVGDALGATVEFMLPQEIVSQYGCHDKIRGGGWLQLKSGHVTDDTTMALALGECLVKGVPLNALLFAEAFDRWLRSKPVDVGNTVRRGIVNFRLTSNPEAPENDLDAGNGACMRLAPLAIVSRNWSLDVTRKVSEWQSHVTHHNAISDAAVHCIVDMIQDGLAGKTMKDEGWKRVDQLQDAWPCYVHRCKKHNNPSAYVVHTMVAVFQSLWENSTFEQSLVDVVNRGGDADTTGAIAGMIAGAFYGVNQIPIRWLKALDSTIYKEIYWQTRRLLELSLQPITTL